MKQFLLLRSNKQTGPYSAEELQQLGLKPYDLIWVEGRSAAWRYPGEVDELKSFAPPVEEQPYDRFYKKPEAASRQEQSSVDTPVVHSQPVIEPSERPAPKKEKEYKRVFVTLPSSAATPGTRIEKPMPAPAEKQQEFHQPVQQDIISGPAPAPLPEKDLPEKMWSAPQAAKQPQATSGKAPAVREAEDNDYFPRKKTFRIKPLPFAALVMGMVSMIALGIWIGVSINNKNEGASLIRKDDPVTGNPNQNGAGLVNQQTAETSQQLIVPDSVENRQNTPPPETKKPVRVPTPSNLNLSTDSARRHSASTGNDDTGNLPTKEELRVKKPVSKPTMPELEKFVSVTSNDYKVGPFGGISRLALTVKNSSDYDLNLVVVQVEYLKVNKEVFKTENLYFRDLAANSSLTLDAPRSNRGNTINYKVTLINSRDHLFHAGN